MFMNLHSLPAGQHLYTVYVAGAKGDDIEDCDEYDFVAPASASAKRVIALLRADYDFTDLYGPDPIFTAVVDQSVGEVVWRA